MRFEWQDFLFTLIVSLCVGVAAFLITFGLSSNDVYTSLGVALLSGLVSLYPGYLVFRYNQISKLGRRSFDDLRTVVEGQSEFLRHGVIDTGEDAFRILRCNPHVGVLFNDWNIDANRNVIFNINTVLMLFKHIAVHGNAKALGRECGETFGSKISKRVELDNANLVQVLEAWSKFDSMAGFGRFHFSEIRNDSFCVRLENNFLMGDDKKENVEVSQFVTGYIEGFLRSVPARALRQSNLQDATFIVSYNESQSEGAGAYRFQGEGCLWNVKVLGKPEVDNQY